MPKSVYTYTNPEGVLVQVFGYKRPAKSERTWPAIRGSIANMGHQAVGLAVAGMNKRPRG
jgi:hypothetical protein